MSHRFCPFCGAPVQPGGNFCISCGKKIDHGQDWQATVPERLAAALGAQFSIIGELGRGGFAVVYSVRDAKRGGYLAVKVMRPDLMPSAGTMERFRREAQFVSQLDHSNILRILFTGKDAGLVYYGMPRVRGPTLRERVDTDGPAPPDEARHLIRQVAEGLHHAHEREVVHRDVKPANVMLERGRAVRILDFGIAKALSAPGGGTITATGEIIGSAEYMSPEQATGSRVIDHRTDIYSLGIVAYELLTGDVPFAGSNFHEIMIKHVTAELPDIRAKRPDVPAILADTVTRCLAKDPAERWPDAAAVAAAVS